MENGHMKIGTKLAILIERVQEGDWGSNPVDHRKYRFDSGRILVVSDSVGDRYFVVTDTTLSPGQLVVIKLASTTPAAWSQLWKLEAI